VTRLVRSDPHRLRAADEDEAGTGRLQGPDDLCPGGEKEWAVGEASTGEGLWVTCQGRTSR